MVPEAAHTSNAFLLPPCPVVFQALLREELRHLSQLSRSLPGYSVQLVGHSLGAGVAAMAAYMINTR
jgi:pimeloyl-ACP methyl ester carboxylesterase